MADNLIQIKRSQTTAVPTSLANGELAFTAAGNVVFIGNFGQVLPIAGERTPGILTANQALVANSTGFINEIKGGNVYVRAINANNSFGAVGDVLTSNGTATYWTSAATLAVGPEYITNTDSRTLSGNLYFTGANTTIDNLFVTNINRSPKLTLTGDVSGNVTFTNLGDASLNVTIEPNSVALGTDTTGDYVASITSGNGVNVSVTSGESATPVIAVVAAGGIVANTTGLYANVDGSTLEISGGAIRVKDDGIALGTKTTGDYVQNITAGNGVSVSVTSGESAQPVIAVVAGSGIIANSTGIHLDTTAGQTFSSLTVNGQTTLNGNVALGDAIQDRVTLNGSLFGSIIPTVDNSFTVGSPGAVYTEGYFTSLRLGSTSGAFITASANTVEVHNLTVNSNIVANTGTFYHNVSIGGDLSITGNIVYSNVESYIVTDPLIQLAANNNDTDLLDIGFFGNYNTGGGAHEHTGLFRDASDGIYKLFDGLQVTPTTFVDTANNTYNQATLQAYLSSGALVSNSSALNITATGSIAVALVANSLTLSTALAADSGGTGQSSYTSGDLLVASGATTLTKLGLGAGGYVLQSNGSALVYATLDGGTF